MDSWHGQRKRQLFKAYDFVMRHEFKKIIGQCTDAIDDLIRDKVILPDNASCVLKKITPDGDVFFKITVTIPVHKYQMKCRLE